MSYQNDSDKEKTKITLRLYTEDLDTLREFYPDVGYNVVVRRVISKFSRQLRETRDINSNKSVKELPLDLNLDSLEVN